MNPNLAAACGAAVLYLGVINVNEFLKTRRELQELAEATYHMDDCTHGLDGKRAKRNLGYRILTWPGYTAGITFNGLE